MAKKRRESTRPPQAASTPAHKPRGVPVWAVCVFLAAATFAVFGQTIRFELVNYDDQYYVTGNPNVLAGLSLDNVRWAFTTNRAALWLPLTWLSLMLDASLAGGRPWLFHLSNVVLHAGTAMLLFTALRRMTGRLWPSAFVAAIFAIHPLRAESVAWVTERKDVLSGLFGMLTLLLYAGYVKRPSPWRYLGTTVALALGLMAKSILVTLPVVMLVLDFWPLRRWTAGGPNLPNAPPATRLMRLLLEKVPWLGLSIATGIATFWAQRQGGAVAPLDLLPLGARAGNALIACVAYLGQMFVPVHLIVIYPLSNVAHPIGEVAGAAAILLAITAISVATARRCPYLLCGWLWYLITLAPVSGIVQVGMQAMADRFTYLPHIGLYIAVAWTVADLAARWRLPRRILGLASAGAIAALMFLAWRQTTHWRDSVTLWEYTLSVSPRNYVAQHLLGNAFAMQGKLAEAVARFEQAIAINPEDPALHFDYATALKDLGRLDEAITQYRIEARLHPADVMTLLDLASALTVKGDVEEGVRTYEQALAAAPGFTPKDGDKPGLIADIHYNLALALTRQGQVAPAITHLKEVLAAFPHHAEAHFYLGLLLQRTGDPTGALDHLQRAVTEARAAGNHPLAARAEAALRSIRSGD